MLLPIYIIYFRLIIANFFNKSSQTFSSKKWGCICQIYDIIISLKLCYVWTLPKTDGVCNKGRGVAVHDMFLIQHRRGKKKEKKKKYNCTVFGSLKVTINPCLIRFWTESCQFQLELEGPKPFNCLLQTRINDIMPRN